MDSLGQRFYNKVQHMKNYISNNLDMFILPESVVFFGGGKLNFETKWIGSILDSEEYAFFEEHLNPSI